MEVIDLILKANKETLLAVKILQSLPTTPIQQDSHGHPLDLEGTPKDYIKALKQLQFGKTSISSTVKRDHPVLRPPQSL